MARITNTIIKKLPGSELEIKGEIPVEVLAPFRTKALQELIQKTELPGFRKGHVPESMVLERVGEVGLLEEAVEHAFPELYVELVKEQNLDVVGRPSVALTTLVPGSPVTFTATVAVMPEIALPNYMELAKKQPRTEPEPVTEHDVEKLLVEFQGQLKTKDAEGKEVVPPIDDTFAARLGNFKTISELRDTTMKGLTDRRALEAKEKRRAAITDAILEKSKFEVPNVFIESELEKMVSQLREDLKRLGSSLEDYLKNIKKTEEEMRKEWRGGAEKRARLQLVLNKIAETEKIEVPAEDIKREAEQILAQFKDADRERVHIYVESVLRNERVLQFLEQQ